MAPSARPGTPLLLRLAVLIAVATALGPGLALTIAQPWHVMGHSMEPALQDGSVLLVDALGPRVGGYGRGDVVVLPVPRTTSYPYPILVKRVVGVAGDRVRISGGRVLINGVPAAEPYLPPGTVSHGTLDVVVPPGALFVMGDHRANSFDSTSFGPVPVTSVVGRAWFAIAPGGVLELPGAAAGNP